MEVIIILLPLSLLLAGTFIAGFIWMTKKGQYDDLDTPSFRMLLDNTEFNNKELSPKKKDLK
jgi:cbb3-type cytochrome oxidase maturation protein